MTSQSNPTQEPKLDAKTVFWNRVQLVLIFVVFLAPIVGAFFYKPTKFNNYGDVYTPAPKVASLELIGEGADNIQNMSEKWLFLVTASDSCDQMCEDSLLKIRQLRHMQGRNLERIRSVFVHSGLSDEIATDLTAKYQPVEVYKADAEKLAEWSKVLAPDGVPANELANRFYIIDSRGLLLISYPPSADPNLIKKDIKRLLKSRR